jgi:hypothetical protein
MPYERIGGSPGRLRVGFRGPKSWLKGGPECQNAVTIAFDRMVRFLQRGHSEVLVTGRWRLAVCALLVGVACMLGVAIEAGANHSVTGWLSTSDTAGNGAFDASVEGYSDDGSRVFFQTDEPMLPTDTDTSIDIYERTGSTTTLISTGPGGGNGAHNADFFEASKDGSRAVFETEESLVSADTDTTKDVYERVGSTTNLVSTGPTSGSTPIDAFFLGTSQDGLHIFFMSYEPLVAADDDNGRRDIYERFNGSTNLISTGPAGTNEWVEASWGGNTPEGGTVFFTTGENLVSGDTDSSKDVYERTGSSTTHISIGPNGGNGSPNAFFEAASIDGSRVFFNTAESLVSSDTDTHRDIYQRSGGTTTQISIGPDGGNGNQPALFGGISLDGSRAFFETRESLVAGDTDGACPDTSEPPLFILLCFDVYERTGGTTTWLSSGGNGSHNASFAAISQEGGRIFFQTTEALVAADTDPGARDVYERFSATTNLISQGPAGGTGNHLADFVGASTDGTRVFFQTYEQLVASDTDATWLDVYERNAGATTLISTGPAAPNGDAIPLWRGSSLDGTRAFFQTDEPLTTTDTDTSWDVYSREAPIAGYPRPKGANPVRVSLVPTYEACTSPNRNHGSPLAHPSCNPPTPRSSVLTVGTPDANGFTALSVSSVRYKVRGNPSPPEDSDVETRIVINDVHCRVANAACPGGVGSDFVGKLLVRTSVQITDKQSGPAESESATVEALPIEIPVDCVAVTGNEGGRCDVTTTVDTFYPGALLDSKRAIWESSEVTVRDPGPNGTGYGAGCPTTCGDGDESVFMRQGIFVP